MTLFGELHPDGRMTNVREISRSDLLGCPHVILVPEHYREEDGSCRCDDPEHVEMARWEYTWNPDRGRWE